MNEKLTVLLPHDTVAGRIRELAQQLNQDYQAIRAEDAPVLVLCTLRGAVFFAADLVRQLGFHCELEFVKIHSYQGTRPADVPTFDLGESICATGRHVLIVEDIVDTGHTMETMLRHFNDQKVKSVRICTLLDKPSRREVPGIVPDYTGFEIDDVFAVGWGLDYNEEFRLLRDIMVYHPDAEEKGTLRR